MGGGGLPDACIRSARTLPGARRRAAESSFPPLIRALLSGVGANFARTIPTERTALPERQTRLLKYAAPAKVPGACFSRAPLVLY